MPGPDKRMEKDQTDGETLPHDSITCSPRFSHVQVLDCKFFFQAVLRHSGLTGKAMLVSHSGSEMTAGGWSSRSTEKERAFRFSFQLHQADGKKVWRINLIPPESKQRCRQLAQKWAYFRDSFEQQPEQSGPKLGSVPAEPRSSVMAGRYAASGPVVTRHRPAEQIRHVRKRATRG